MRLVWVCNGYKGSHVEVFRSEILAFVIGTSVRAIQ